MEKKKYEGMELEVVEFDAEDVILTSGENIDCDNFANGDCHPHGDCNWVCMIV